MTEEIKTLANCTNDEFFDQISNIIDDIKDYSENLGETLISIGKGAKNPLDIFHAICKENTVKRNKIFGGMLFMSGEEFGKLDPRKGDPNGLAIAMRVFTSERFLSFFSLLGLIPEQLKEQLYMQALKNING